MTDKGRTILPTFLTEYHKMKPFLAHLTLLAFHNDKVVDKNDNNNVRLWKIREVLDILKETQTFRN